MKKYIFNLMSLAAIALLGWSCETDYYNEHYLDGYEPNDEITDVQSIEYTLTTADYAAIAGNSTNKAIAEAAGDEAVEALNAIKKNGYFASTEEAQTYIKAFVSSKYNYYLSNGSSVAVNYAVAANVPEELQAMKAAAGYTLKDEAYAAAGSKVKALTPETIGKLTEIVPNDELQLAAGQYVAVTYNWQDSEAAAAAKAVGRKADASNYTSLLGSAKLNEAVAIKGYVSAVCTQGIIVTDNTGSILVYKASGFAVGDEVTVEGTISSYNKGFQLDTTKGAVCTKTGTKADGVTYPVPAVIDGAALDALLGQETDEYAKYVQITGTVAVSGNYYNFNVEGAAKATGSFYGLSDELKSQLKDGEKITLYGYFSSISRQSGEPKFINVIVTKIGTGAPAAGDYTTVLGSAKLDDEVEIKGYISATSTQGPILTDNGGSVLLYKTSGYEIGDEVTVKGKISSFNKGFQISTADLQIEKTGTASVTYPDAKELTGADMDALLTNRTEDGYAEYVKMTGKAVVGNYINFEVPGATTAQGSVYGATDAIKAQLTDGMECTLYGYFISISKQSGEPKFINVIVTSVEPKVVTESYEQRYALLCWNGSAFTAADVTMVQPADYAEMGQTSGYFKAPAQETYLPKFLSKTYPYALAEEVKYVAYKLGANDWAVDEYANDGASWIKNDYIVNENAPFIKAGGEWMFNPNRTIVLNPDKSDFSKKYYQAVVDWVYANKNEKYTYDNRSDSRITDAEYYSGCATGYTNLNWRINTLPKYYWSAAGEDVSAYEKYTSDNVEESKAAYEAFYKEAEKHFAESMAAALGVLHADQKMIEGVETIFTIQMMLYTQHIGSSTGRVTHAFEFKLVDNGKFEYVRMYALEDRFELMKDSNWQ